MQSDGGERAANSSMAATPEMEFQSKVRRGKSKSTSLGREFLLMGPVWVLHA
jgi:hypothetical protein